MAKMVRKQIYIAPHHDRALKRLAESRGVSEAEIIRQAIDGQLGGARQSWTSDPEAWEAAHQFMRQLRAQGPAEGQPRAWKRDDLYEERLSRHARDPH